MKIFIRKLIAFTLFVFFTLTSIGNFCVAKEKRQKNLFFCINYKIPNMLAIALSHPEDENDIIIIDYNKNIIDKLKTIFNHIYISNNEESRNEFMKKKDSYDKIFIFNIKCFYDYMGYRPNRYFHVEDGLNEYTYESSNTWLWNKDRMEKIFLTFPEYRLESLKSINAEPISRENYLKAIDILYDPKPINYKILYCLDNPEIADKKSENQIINIIKNYNNVALKHHPRDKRRLLWPKNFTVLNRSKPFEGFYYGFNGILISNLSSCLHTAKFMKPDSTVICTIYLDHNKITKDQEKYINMIKDLGVLFPKTMDELNSMISKNINKN